jgi:deoxyribodipyrimidine photolyase-like uncharacterized protein
VSFCRTVYISLSCYKQGHTFHNHEEQLWMTSIRVHLVSLRFQSSLECFISLIWVMEWCFMHHLCRLSCIANLCMYITLEPRTNSYVALYDVVFLESKHCVSHTHTTPIIFILTLVFECYLYFYLWSLFIATI